MKQIARATLLFTDKRKFILFLTAIFLFVPAIACAQVNELPNEQAETVPMWPESNEAETEVNVNSESLTLQSFEPS